MYTACYNKGIGTSHAHSISYPIIITQTGTMAQSTVPYPFPFGGLSASSVEKPGKKGRLEAEVNITLQNVRGRIPSPQTSRLRTMLLDAQGDSSKILAHACTYDGLSSRLVEEAGFPMVFLSGYSVASAYGLPDTGYIALEDMCDKIRECRRVVSVPIMVDGDTGYGSPLNVRRSVESFALAGAAGVMIEDQTWPKRRYPQWTFQCDCC